MSTISSITNATSAAAVSQTGSGDEVSKEDFLQLLVTQLKHQDPLSPISNEDFLAQLAQFSSLEQLQNINTGTQTGLLLQQSVTNSLATSLIGKEVLVGTDTLSIEGGQGVDFCFSLGAAGHVTAEIRDAQGGLVRTLRVDGEDGLALTPGEHAFRWDGRDENGEPVADGQYTISVEAVDDDGAAISVSNYLNGRVDGIRFAAGGAYIVIGEMEFTLADVVEIMGAPQSSLARG
jgi:flagellar basal-body rod modification protein FlgD